MGLHHRITFHPCLRCHLTACTAPSSRYRPFSAIREALVALVRLTCHQVEVSGEAQAAKPASKRTISRLRPGITLVHRRLTCMVATQVPVRTQLHRTTMADTHRRQ